MLMRSLGSLAEGAELDDRASMGPTLLSVGSWLRIQVVFQLKPHMGDNDMDGRKRKEE